MKPMLARPLDLRQVDSYLTNDDWVAQQKLDGDRILILARDGKVQALNREGTPRRNRVPRRVLDQFQCFASMPGTWCFDGELMTSGELWLFDLPAAGDGVGAGDQPFSFRYAVLERFMAAGTWPTDPCVRLLPIARTTEAKQTLFSELRERGAEGLVFRHHDGPYRAGKRSDMMLKAKFTFTVDAVVHEVRPDGRNNCTYRLFDNGTWVPAGSCSLEARPEVRPGDVIEVRALYASAEGLLYQPVMLRVRHDKSPTECTVDQLRFTDRSIVPMPASIVEVARSPRGQKGHVVSWVSEDGHRHTACGRTLATVLNSGHVDVHDLGENVCRQCRHRTTTETAA
jgi:ATP-dependent DNA ligase